MSGGVDSSVAAALLKEQGYDVVGMMLRLWSEENCDTNRCCTPESIEDARSIADFLDIPFYVLDYQTPFKNTVVDYFTTSYSQGVTPNPCLVCNKKVRFGMLLEEAKKLGANYMATGHYVRTKEVDGKIELYKGLDPSKDQSYVLYQLDQDQLSHMMFPLGEFNKTYVRELAEKFELSVAKRPDSQDLCFIGDDGYRGFLERHAPESLKPGPIRNQQGKLLGNHQGLPGYTIGQRRGLGISTKEPHFVLNLDSKTNTLVVGTKDERGKEVFRTKETRYISGEELQTPLPILVKIRYTTQPVAATLYPLPDGLAEIRLDKPLGDITPGQGAVFYLDDQVIGGGIIIKEQ